MIDALITHLRDNTTSFVTITHALSMEPIDDLTEESPAAYLYLGGESASLSDGDGYIAQEVTRTIACFVVGTHDRMMALRSELRALILNYQADSYHTPCEFVSGETATIKGAYQWWQDTYITRTHYRDLDLEIPN